MKLEPSLVAVQKSVSKDRLNFSPLGYYQICWRSGADTLTGDDDGALQDEAGAREAAA